MANAAMQNAEQHAQIRSDVRVLKERIDNYTKLMWVILIALIPVMIKSITG